LSDNGCARSRSAPISLSYRAYHLAHHKFTQQAKDPDLSPSAPFPITKDSYARQAIRDLTGQTFVKQHLPLLLSLFERSARGEVVMHARFVASGREKVARFLAVNALLFALFDLAGAGVWFFRCLAGCDGELAVAGDAHPQYRRARLHLKRRRPVQPRPDHTRKLDRAGADRALLGELLRRTSSVQVSALLPAGASASALVAKGSLIKRIKGAARLSRRDAARHIRLGSFCLIFWQEPVAPFCGACWAREIMR
jgi:hypothetical protein